MTHPVGQPTHAVPPNGHRAPDQQGPAHPPVPESRRAAVPLRRLLGLATLTPAQAGFVAVEVLSALDGDRAGYGVFDASDVLVDEDGTVRLSERDGDVRPGATTAAGKLLAELEHNADRPAAHRKPANAALLAALTRAAGQLADAQPEPALADLRRALDNAGAGRDRLAGELAALVAVPLIRVGAEPEQLADTGTDLPEPLVDTSPPPGLLTQRPQGAPPLGRPLEEPADTPPPAVLPRLRTGRAVPHWRLIVAAAAAVLVVGAIIAAVALTRPGGRPARAAVKPSVTVSHSATPSPSTHATRRPGPRAVPSLAPAAAGPISKVTMRPTGSCGAGGTCDVTVTIHLRPPSLSNLTWHAALVDRCTGSVHTVDHGSMIAQSGWQSVYATVSLPLPRKSSMALVALVDSPVSVASKPLLVPASGGTCPQG